MEIIRESRAGVKYIIPISDKGGFIKSGVCTEDDRIYRQTRRGYLVRVK